MDTGLDSNGETSAAPVAFNRPPRVALIHDWLNQYGGAERVLETLHDLFPNAPIFTSIYWRDGMPTEYRSWDIRTSWMDRLPGIHHHHQLFFPLYALAFARLRIKLSEYDLVLSNKSGFCHGVRTEGLPHLCYCLSPTRYVWQFDHYAAREALPASVKLALRPVVAALRRWDFYVAQRPEMRFVAISSEIHDRVARFYQRDSQIVYPPVDVERFQPRESHEAYYLVVSRLIPYKRIDLAVEAFTRMGLPLIVVGTGRERAALESMAGPNVRFLGRVPDKALPDLYARCKAFVFPGYEDFGLAPVEAQAAGRPVIAYRAGGALDTVVDGVTGTFFAEQTPEALIEAVQTFDAEGVDPNACRRNAERFSVAQFRSEMTQLVAQILVR